jgi:hypothetical protein
MLLSLPWKEGRPPMPEYLTPEEVELWARGGSVIAGDTLRAYAKVVEAVAKMDASSECCQLCNAYIRWNGEGHKPECPYLLARKLRGHAE